MAKKATNPVKPALDGIRRWQGYWNLTDDFCAEKLGVCKSTWQRWKNGKSEISHKDLIRVCNFLRIPEFDAMPMLTAGYCVKEIRA